MKIAVLEISESDSGGWDDYTTMLSLVSFTYKEATEEEYRELVAACSHYNNQRKPTRLVVVKEAEPLQIDTVVQEWREAYAAIQKRAAEYKQRKAEQAKKRQETALAKKRAKLEQLKKELGDA